MPQVQTLSDPRLQFGYQQMPMVEPLQGGHGWDRTPIAHLKESYSDLHVVHKAIEIVEQNQILVDAVRENGQVSPCRRLRNSTLTLDLACEQF